MVLPYFSMITTSLLVFTPDCMPFQMPNIFTKTVWQKSCINAPRAHSQQYNINERRNTKKNIRGCISLRESLFNSPALIRTYKIIHMVQSSQCDKPNTENHTFRCTDKEHASKNDTTYLVCSNTEKNTRNRWINLLLGVSWQSACLQIIYSYLFIYQNTMNHD